MVLNDEPDICVYGARYSLDASTTGKTSNIVLIDRTIYPVSIVLT
jgi:hypothetical protein